MQWLHIAYRCLIRKNCQAVPEDFPVRLPVTRPEVPASAQWGERET